MSFTSNLGDFTYFNGTYELEIDDNVRVFVIYSNNIYKEIEYLMYAYSVLICITYFGYYIINKCLSKKETNEINDSEESPVNSESQAECDEDENEAIETEQDYISENESSQYSSDDEEKKESKEQVIDDNIDLTELSNEERMELLNKHNIPSFNYIKTVFSFLSNKQLTKIIGTTILREKYGSVKQPKNILIAEAILKFKTKVIKFGLLNYPYFTKNALQYVNDNLEHVVHDVQNLYE